MIHDQIKTFVRNILVATRLIEQPDYVVQLVEEHPLDDEIAPGVLYVVGGKEYQKWAYFRCPTNSGEIIQLSLMKNRRPCWSVKADWMQRATVHPSVRQTAGSFAHFWVKGGKVNLCPDSGRKSSPMQSR
jgi:hypothetical protein